MSASKKQREDLEKLFQSNFILSLKETFNKELYLIDAGEDKSPSILRDYRYKLL